MLRYGCLSYLICSVHHIKVSSVKAALLLSIPASQEIQLHTQMPILNHETTSPTSNRPFLVLKNSKRLLRNTQLFSLIEFTPAHEVQWISHTYSPYNRMSLQQAAFRAKPNCSVGLKGVLQCPRWRISSCLLSQCFAIRTYSLYPLFNS